MANNKPKAASLTKSTKAQSAAYNTSNKLRIAKEEKTKVKSKLASELVGTKKEKALKTTSAKISQAVTDRSRSTTRAAGIAKREAPIKLKPKPAPSPTAVSQLKPYLRFLNPETDRYDDIRKGIYKGKSYDVDPTTKKITLNVKDTKNYIDGLKRDKQR